MRRAICTHTHTHTHSPEQRIIMMQRICNVKPSKAAHSAAELDQPLWIVARMNAQQLHLHKYDEHYAIRTSVHKYKCKQTHTHTHTHTRSHMYMSNCISRLPRGSLFAFLRFSMLLIYLFGRDHYTPPHIHAHTHTYSHTDRRRRCILTAHRFVRPLCGNTFVCSLRVNMKIIINYNNNNNTKRICNRYLPIQTKYVAYFILCMYIQNSL